MKAKHRNNDEALNGGRYGSMANKIPRTKYEIPPFMPLVRNFLETPKTTQVVAIALGCPLELGW